MKQDYVGLIIDLGVAEGNDTAFYLSKGFRVIAVEASPILCKSLQERFAHEVKLGSLKILNFAASEIFGDVVTFFHHSDHFGISSLCKRPEVEDKYTEMLVNTIDWNTLSAQAGVPRYLKIDIEGNEGSFLKGMRGRRDLPEFISIEAYEWVPIEMLFELGYRRFKLVDQNSGFRLPARQFEGISVETADFVHSSGPFGLDVFTEGDWRNYDEIKADWIVAAGEMSKTWFDCHAWMPN